MLSRDAIQFYINGPPPNATSNGQTSLVNLINADALPGIIDDVLEKPSESQNPSSLADKSCITLLTVRSIRWLDLFPDKLIIDENKVSFIYKDAFRVRSIHSVLIENITYVEAHTSFLKGCLVVTDSSNYRHPIELKLDNLRKDAAIRARKLIQGLIYAKTLKMDFGELNPFDLEKNLEKLGRVLGED